MISDSSSVNNSLDAEESDDLLDKRKKSFLNKIVKSRVLLGHVTTNVSQAAAADTLTRASPY